METTTQAGAKPVPVAPGAMVSIDAHIQDRIQAAIQDLRAEYDERLRKLEEQRDTPAPPEKGNAEPGNVQYIAGTNIPAEIASSGPRTVPTPPIKGTEGMSPNQIIAAHQEGMIDVTRGQHKTEDERRAEADQAKADEERTEGEETTEETEEEENLRLQAQGESGQQLQNEGVAAVDVEKQEGATRQFDPQQITPETAPGLDAQAQAERQE